MWGWGPNSGARDSGGQVRRGEKPWGQGSRSGLLTPRGLVAGGGWRVSAACPKPTLPSASAAEAASSSPRCALAGSLPGGGCWGRGVSWEGRAPGDASGVEQLPARCPVALVCCLGQECDQGDLEDGLGRAERELHPHSSPFPSRVLASRGVILRPAVTNGQRGGIVSQTVEFLVSSCFVPVIAFIHF